VFQNTPGQLPFMFVPFPYFLILISFDYVLSYCLLLKDSSNKTKHVNASANRNSTHAVVWDSTVLHKTQILLPNLAAHVLSPYCFSDRALK